MNSTYRWIALVGALLLAATVGFAAWQAGVAHGIEQSGKIVVPPSGAAGGPYPYPYPYYGWHPWGRPWGFGFGFLFVPLFFIFWFLVVRGLFWRRAWYGGYGGCGPRGRFDEWHRQAHARGASETGEATPGVSSER